MSSLRPLFRFDPGWLFTVAGLAIMVASALLPAQHDVAVLKEQLAKLEQEEKVNHRRTESYQQFLAELKAKDPALLTRLAASQLNLMPEGEAPVLMATSMEHTASDWIEATVPPEAFEPNLVPDTLLTRLASGQRRLWLMGGGALIVFIGLTLGIPLTPSKKFVASEQEEQWLEQIEASSPAAGVGLEMVGTSLDAPADPAAPVPHGAGDWPSDLAPQEEADLPTEEAGAVSAEKWAWDVDENSEPYFTMALADSGDSAAGAQVFDAGVGNDDIHWRAAD